MGDHAAPGTSSPRPPPASPRRRGSKLIGRILHSARCSSQSTSLPPPPAPPQADDSRVSDQGLAGGGGSFQEGGGGEGEKWGERGEAFDENRRFGATAVRRLTAISSALVSFTGAFAARADFWSAAECGEGKESMRGWGTAIHRDVVEGTAYLASSSAPASGSSRSPTCPRLTPWRSPLNTSTSVVPSGHGRRFTGRDTRRPVPEALRTTSTAAAS